MIEDARFWQRKYLELLRAHTEVIGLILGEEPTDQQSMLPEQRAAIPAEQLEQLEHLRGGVRKIVDGLRAAQEQQEAQQQAVAQGGQP